LAPRFPGAILIGSDQAASCEGVLLGKPGTRERAVEQLSLAAGRAVEFHTAVAVLDAGSGRHRIERVLTTVRFRALGQDAIERYLALEPSLDCAGSFKCEGLGIALFEAIDTRDPTALVGLPLIATARLLREFGLDALG
jgi:septum formation protein